MIDKKLIVVGSLLLTTLVVIGVFMLIKHLTTPESVLKVPAEANGMDQYCAYDNVSGKYTFLFAKDNVVAVNVVDYFYIASFHNDVNTHLLIFNKSLA